MAFFFAISAQGPPKGKGKKQASAPDPQSDDSNDEVVTPSQVASNASPVWIALTMPNEAPAIPIFIHRALLDCDVETMANQVYHF